MPNDNETAIKGMLQAYNDREFGDFAAGYTNDAVIVYPQSDERIVGRDNIKGMVEAFPSAPKFHIRATHSAGDIVVVEADADYGEGPLYKGVFIYKMIDGLVSFESAYFAGPFEAAGWRAPYRE